MRIDRFGLLYASAYEFPQNMMEDSWSISRPAVYARVGGLPGAFDYYGDSAFPFEPFVITKKLMLQANGDHESIEALVEALRAATIARTDESRLWFLRRSGGTRWMWAKCTRLDVSDSWNSYFAVTATVEFYCREGAFNPL